MGEYIDDGRTWISDNRLVLISIGVLGLFLLAAIFLPYLEIQKAIIAGLTVGLLLFGVFHSERRRWIDEHRIYGSLLLVGSFLLFIGTVTSLLKLSTSIIVASLIGSLIPGIYYAYTEIIKRPSIEISKLHFTDASVAPMYFNNIPHIARPAIFLNVEVENTGHATAENCAIKILYESNENDEEASSYARWAIPEADERYNLLPDESLSIHILKIFLTKDFFLLKDPDADVIQDISRALGENVELTTLVDRTVAPQNNPTGNIRIDINWSDQIDGFTIGQITTGDGRKEGTLYGEIIEKEDIIDQLCSYYPIRKAPEQGESVRGGWAGHEIERGEYTLKLHPLAENYKKPRETLPIEGAGDDTLKLTIQEIARKLSRETVTWQDQWTDKGYTEFKDRVMTFCNEIMEDSA